MINEYLKIVWMKINGNTTALLHVCLHLERDVCCIQDSGDDRLLAGSTAFTDKTLLPHMVSNVHVAQTVLKKRHSGISSDSVRNLVCSVGLETARLILL